MAHRVILRETETEDDADLWCLSTTEVSPTEFITVGGKRVVYFTRRTPGREEVYRGVVVQGVAVSAEYFIKGGKRAVDVEDITDPELKYNIFFNIHRLKAVVFAEDVIQNTLYFICCLTRS